MNVSKFGIPDKSVWYLVTCAAIILAVCLMALLPLYRHNSVARDNIKKINNQIKQQTDLNPQYQLLTKVLEKKQPQTLSNPQRTQLPRDQIGNLQEVFKNIAEKAGLMIASFTPDMTNLSGDSQYIFYSVTAKGNLNNFRRLLIDLGGVSYVDRIEEISIQQGADSLEYKLRILVALGK